MKPPSQAFCFKRTLAQWDQTVPLASKQLLGLLAIPSPVRVLFLGSLFSFIGPSVSSSRSRRERGAMPALDPMSHTEFDGHLSLSRLKRPGSEFENA